MQQKPEQKEEPKPKVVDFTTEAPSSSNKRQSSFNMSGLGGLGGLIPAIVVGVGVWFLLTNPTSPLVTKKDFTSNIQQMIAADDGIKSSVTQQLAAQTNDVTSRLNAQNAQVNSKVDSLLGQFNTLATKGSVEALSGLPNQVANQLVLSKTEQQKVLDGVLKAIDDKITTQGNNVSNQVGAFDTRLKAVENKQVVSGVQLTANVSSGQISLGINADQDQYVSFRIVFRLLTGSISGNATSDALIQSLYAAPPVSVSTNVVLTPLYKYIWQGGSWNVTQIEFITARTAIGKGYQAKTLSYSFSDATRTYDVLIEPLIDSLVGTGGSNW